MKELLATYLITVNDAAMYLGIKAPDLTRLETKATLCRFQLVTFVSQAIEVGEVPRSCN